MYRANALFVLLLMLTSPQLAAEEAVSQYPLTDAVIYAEDE